MTTLITMENILSPCFSLPAFIGFLILFHEVLKWFIRIQTSYSSMQPLPLLPFSFFIFVESSSILRAEKKDLSSSRLSREEDADADVDDENILNLKPGDFEMVMNRIGIFGNPVSDQKLNERLGSDYFSSLFEENEPSFEEVKEAFDVFDENKDGFIDASELQRILCCLGLKEGLNLKECERMIRVYDENSDGKIDFNEFVKFMEKSL